MFLLTIGSGVTFAPETAGTRIEPGNLNAVAFRINRLHKQIINVIKRQTKMFIYRETEAAKPVGNKTPV